MSTQPVVAPDAEPDDFMPLHGIDHVELYVGNALQAAYFYVARARLPARSPTPASRPACATAPRTCSSRAASGSSSPAR